MACGGTFLVILVGFICLLDNLDKKYLDNFVSCFFLYICILV